MPDISWAGVYGECMLYQNQTLFNKLIWRFELTTLDVPILKTNFQFFMVKLSLTLVSSLSIFCRICGNWGSMKKDTNNIILYRNHVTSLQASWILHSLSRFKNQDYCISTLFETLTVEEWVLSIGLIMDVLQMDTHRYLNEFMHLSVSKVSQWHLNMPPRFDVMIVTVTFPG